MTGGDGTPIDQTGTSFRSETAPLAAEVEPDLGVDHDLLGGR